MTSPWHERIQRYLDGQAGAEESAELEAAIRSDPEVLALYLDYVNLDVALGTAAEMATLAENGAGRAAIPSRPPRLLSTGRWPWLAAAAACAALVLFSLRLGHRSPSQTGPDIDAACSSTQAPLARLAMESPLFPEWMSPTASMLNQPRPRKGDL